MVRPEETEQLPGMAPAQQSQQGRTPSVIVAPPGATTTVGPAGERKPPAFSVEKRSVTKHIVRIGGQELRYTATAGTIVLKKEDDTPIASIFFIAYTKDGVRDLSARPVTFSFNGGPGSSSVWMHLGLLGPRRIMTDNDGNPTPPPFRLIDNENSALDLTDLVFIDPVGTGYSRAVPPTPGVTSTVPNVYEPIPGVPNRPPSPSATDDPRRFYGFSGDIESVGDFIRLYVARNNRWASPKFVIGESYGTTRAAALSGFLQANYGMYLNGVILISTVLNFETLSFTPGNDISYVLFLPTYTATAWYHRKLAPDLQGDLARALDEAEKFAMGEYAMALMRGDSLSADERRDIVQKVARYTGLSPDYVDRANMRVSIFRFVKELLRNERRTVGRYDSRYLGIDSDAAGETFEYDPADAVIRGVYSTMFNNYVRAELGFESDLTYEVLTGRVQPWSYAQFENRYVNVSETLRQAMTQNPNLRVFVACGYYDLATPFLGSKYTFSHLGLDPSLRGHVTLGFYESGHMVYMHRPSLEKLKRDLAQFFRNALSANDIIRG